ncbi:HEAT repeat domain-containing protein [Luteococcus peritonei]|uniref:HEAT repeat domain-containing protein n=1 Tax=Luteococcus peritonei TaxID=88874 RepID=A0ABW4RXQ5_9ACTN
MTSLPTLMAALRGDDATRRQQAALLLGGQPVAQVMDELVELMAGEPDDFVRETLIWAVVQDPAAAAPALVSALGREELPREPVLHALSKVGDPTTVPAILPHAGSEDPVVAAKAWWALGRIADESSLPVLLSHLGAEKAELRHGLTRALLQFGARAIDALERELEHPEAAHRSHAAEVLVAFANPDQYGTAERRSGQDFSQQAAEVLRRSTVPEVDGALLLATVSDDRPGLSGAAGALREERG